MLQIGNGLSMSSHVRRGKAAYIWISPYPMKVGLTLGVVVVLGYKMLGTCISWSN